MEQVECIIAGAGVIGLAVARALALAGRECLILEKTDLIGSGTSSRNSEVIHAGIYYRQDSLIARFCVAGRKALYTYCEEHGVGHQRCGKLIVATNEDENQQLAGIAERAARNGVDDLRRLSGEEARALEPDLNCTAALLSPSTGILDSHGFMLSLRGDAEEAGTAIALGAPVKSVRASEDGFVVEVGGADPMTLGCRIFVNCAGLEAPALAQRIEGLAPEHVPQAYFAKGNYFTLQGRAPFRHLIYPVPVPGALGVHLTLDLGRQARFGPDIEWVDGIDYSVDPRRGDSFYAAIRRYWPGLGDGRLQPGYCGIRPKIVPQGAPAQDFVLQGPRDHGVPGLINLFGIESPGLTSSLAIADHVAAML